MKSCHYIFVSCLLLIGCSVASPPDDEKIIGMLIDQEFERVYNDIVASELKNSMTVNEFIEKWEENAHGEFENTHSLKSSKRGDAYRVIEAEIEYSDSAFQLRLTLNQENKIVGFATSELALLPNSIIEKDVTVGEGTDYELDGTLTLPKNQQKNLPAVVLVHGSGPSDRNEAVYQYEPFRDIAWGLGEKGIAVLRYDKRTFSYQLSNDLTVQEETIEDAIRAGELLKKNSRIDSDQVYLLGHSLGGMLAPRIDLDGDFAGLIILAGSPRPLWEIIYDQNMEMNLNEDEQQQIEQEYEKAQQISNMTIDEAKEETVFGLPAYYFKEMNNYDAGRLAQESTKPMLFLQGEDDFQVYPDIDFSMWKELLQRNDNATFISYPGLNHFFIDYDGPGAGTVAEYAQPGKVDVIVINDIADWISDQN
ncbi:alpha/beta fold hydrolase [Gracilibacillus saliphilus]|uniref:alpha/beta hydrolase n=1 Tax=Gracilibacillus saliphilus TaxID=543890 RepID=UPI0013D65E2E|nr:alpha/beta fold hydrolase [Gracilibacillus saliphilus]